MAYAHSISSQVAFNAGEWSPSLDSRIDHQKYKNACRKLQNFICLREGGAVRRPGSQFIAFSATGAQVTERYTTRLAKFQYDPSTGYVLEFSHYTLRFFYNGALLTSGGSPIVITTPYSADTTDGTNPQNTDVFNVKLCQINDVVYLVHPSYAPYKLIRLSHTSWTLQKVSFNMPAMLDQNASQTTLQAFQGQGSWPYPAWVTSHAYTVGTLVVQSNKLYVCLIAHTSGTFATDLAAGKWEDTTPTGATGSLTGAVKVTASSTAWATGSYYYVGDTCLYSGDIYQCRSQHVGSVFATDLANGNWQLAQTFQPSHVGSRWKMSFNRASNIMEEVISTNETSATISCYGKFTVQTFGTWHAHLTLQKSIDNGATWQTLATYTSRSDANYSDDSMSCSETAQLRIVVSGWASTTSTTTARVVITVLNQFIDGLFEITGYVDHYNVYANVIKPLYIDPSVTGQTLTTVYWNEGAWSDYRGYPSCLTSFQQRLWYANTANNPQTIWATVTDDIENFDLGDQTLATDGLSLTLNAVGDGPIQWISSQTDLYLGLANAEWVVNAGDNSTTSAITPSAVAAKRQSGWGSSSVGAVSMGDSVIFAQRDRRALRQMMYSVFQQKYMSNDILMLSNHISQTGINQLDIQKSFQGQSILWGISNGKLIGMTYEFDQEVYGWHEHTFDPGYLYDNNPVESVTCINGQTGQNDEVWVSVRRNVNGTVYYCIERLDPFYYLMPADADIFPDVYKKISPYYMDSWVEVSGISGSTITGLTNLAAHAVNVIVNYGITFEGLSVGVDGSLTIPYTLDPSTDVVAIGMSEISTLKPMRMDIDSRFGVMQGLQKSVDDVYLRLVNSLTCNVSTASGYNKDLDLYKSTAMFARQVPFTGEYHLDDIRGEFTNDPELTITATNGLPLYILGIIVNFGLGNQP